MNSGSYFVRVPKRVTRNDKSLTWVFLSAATGEAGRSGLRLILKYSMRLLR
jgi:hypothetical protein